jgi:ribosomal protein L34E
MTTPTTETPTTYADEVMPPTCSRCGRELHAWPLRRPRGCSPARWVHCIRDDNRPPTTLEGNDDD